MVNLTPLASSKQNNSNLFTLVKNEINTPNKLISISIPNQVNGQPMIPIQVVNMASYPKQISLKQDNKSNCQMQHKKKERKLRKRPEKSSPTTKKRNQANLMNHIQELHYSRIRRLRGNRSRMRLFSNTSSQHPATEIKTLNLPNSLASPQQQQQESNICQTQVVNTAPLQCGNKINKDSSSNWVLVASGQTDNQKQITQQARTFLQLNPQSPKRPRRIAVIPLLRMNCTVTSPEA